MVSITQTNLQTYSYIDDSFLFTIKRNGIAQDITDWTIYFTIKRNKGDSEALVSKEITSHTSPTEGKTTISLDKEDTQTLSGDFWYDIKVDDSQNKRKIYSEGKFTINPGVKRD